MLTVFARYEDGTEIIRSAKDVKFYPRHEDKKEQIVVNEGETGFVIGKSENPQIPRQVFVMNDKGSTVRSYQL